MHHVKGIGIVDIAGKKVRSKREQDLKLAAVYGAQGDTSAFTRLIIESKVSRANLNAAWATGKNSKFATA